jgi:hypothetical protein
MTRMVDGKNRTGALMEGLKSGEAPERGLRTWCV